MSMKNNTQIHNAVVKFLAHKDALRYVAMLVNVTCDKDATVRRILNILAATQEIELARKDELRKQIRAWFKANVGDRTFFADSDLHRKWKRAA